MKTLFAGLFSLLMFSLQTDLNQTPEGIVVREATRL